MPKVMLESNSPEFKLEDYQGNLVELSNYRNQKNILLVFNRGFV